MSNDRRPLRGWFQRLQATLTALRHTLARAIAGTSRAARRAAAKGSHVLVGFWRWFVSVPWRRFLIAYAGLILVFAFVYAAMPGEFYHATLTREPGYTREVRAIRLAFESLVNDSTLRVPAAFGPYSGFVPAYVLIDDLAFESDNVLSFRLGCSVFVEKPTRWTTGIWCRVRMIGIGSPVFPRRDRATADYRDAIHMIPIEIIHLSGPDVGEAAIAALLRCPAGGIISPGYWTCLPPDLMWRVNALRTAVAGQPMEFPGNFVRMLYLSAGMVTAAGFGDIQPLTTRARVVALSEAFLGIVVISFFVNALAKPWRGQ